MSILFQSCEPIEGGTKNWLVGIADRASLGAKDCGCGERTDNYRAIDNGPVVELHFYHDDGECIAAFAKPDYRPLTRDEYIKILGLEVED